MTETQAWWLIAGVGAIVLLLFFGLGGIEQKLDRIARALDERDKERK